MINDGPLARFVPLADGFVNPIYADYSFANIASTVEYLLTGSVRGPLLPPDCFGGQYPQPRRIVLFFIDAFGWRSAFRALAVLVVLWIVPASLLLMRMEIRGQTPNSFSLTRKPNSGSDPEVSPDFSLINGPRQAVV